MCQYCNVVAHAACARQVHNDLPAAQGHDDFWVCVECQRELDARRHVNDCDQCNLTDFIFHDIERMIELLKEIAPSLGENVEAGMCSTADALIVELGRSEEVFVSTSLT